MSLLFAEEDESTEFSVKQWSLQVGLAVSLLHANDVGLLDEQDEELIPWSQAVIKMEDLLQKRRQICGVSETSEFFDGNDLQGFDQEEEVRELEMLTDDLRYERVKVETLLEKRLLDINSSEHKESKEEEVDDTDYNSPISVLLKNCSDATKRVTKLRTELKRYVTTNTVTGKVFEELYLYIRNQTSYLGAAHADKQDEFDFNMDSTTRANLLMENKKAQKYIYSRLVFYDANLVEGLVELVQLEDNLSYLHKNIEETMEQVEAGEADQDVVITEDAGESWVAPSPKAKHAPEMWGDTEAVEETDWVAEDYEQQDYTQQEWDDYYACGDAAVPEGKHEEAYTEQAYTEQAYNENEYVEQAYAEQEEDNRKSYEQKVTEWDYDSDATEEDEIIEQIIETNISKPVAKPDISAKEWKAKEILAARQRAFKSYSPKGTNEYTYQQDDELYESKEGEEPYDEAGYGNGYGDEAEYNDSAYNAEYDNTEYTYNTETQEVY